MEERYQSESCVIGISLGNRKSMVSDSMMMDVEGIECVHLYTSNRRSSLTCPERAGGQEEIWGKSVAY